jgi:predicted Zn-dependent protease
MAARNENHETARLHYQLALQQRPQVLKVLSNLAWALARHDPPELNVAIRMADAARDAAPDHPEVLATRGQVLAMLGRWQECVVDLEKAAALPDDSGVREELARAHEKIRMESRGRERTGVHQ